LDATGDGAGIYKTKLTIHVTSHAAETKAIKNNLSKDEAALTYEANLDESLS
jgi:hypothetical protein